MKGWLTKARLAAGKAEPHASSAAEWLLDNDYQIQRAILQIREDLPQEFYAKLPGLGEGGLARPRIHQLAHRSEEHTSELQSLMRISYAVFCLKKKTQTTKKHNRQTTE